MTRCCALETGGNRGCNFARQVLVVFLNGSLQGLDGRKTRLVVADDIFILSLACLKKSIAAATSVRLVRKAWRPSQDFFDIEIRRSLILLSQ